MWHNYRQCILMEAAVHSPTQAHPHPGLLLRTAARRADGLVVMPDILRGGARVKTLSGLLRHGVRTANPANLGLHPDGVEAPRSRSPYCDLGRKDPFCLGHLCVRRPQQ